MNLWVHDGSKDITVNRYRYRKLFKESLDEIFATKYDNMKDCLESKTFGIGLESFTSGSLEFVVGYCVENQKIYTIDTGHYHPLRGCFRQSIVNAPVCSRTDAPRDPRRALGL